MTSSYLNVDLFDMDRIKPGSTILVLGDRGTGKTTIAREILYHVRKYPMGIVMAGSLDTVEEYRRHVPESLIYDEYVSDVIRRIMDVQDAGRAAYGFKNMKPLFLVLDDLMFDKRVINNDPLFRKAMLNGRHYKITIIICAQYVKHVSAELRPNVDFVFTTFQKNPDQRNKILAEFDVGFPSKIVFRDTMFKCTENWGCMVLDKRSSGRQGLGDSVFHARANIGRKFKVGPRSLWRKERRARISGSTSRDPAMMDPREQKRRHIVVRKVKRSHKASWL